MKLVGVISTAVLSLALGVAVPALAQDHEQDDQKAKSAQEEKKAQPEKPAKQGEKSAQEQKNAKPEEKNAQQEEKNAKPEEKNAQQENKNAKPEEQNAQQQEKNAKPAEKNARPEQHAAGNGDRIPADRYKASFGQQHTFRVSQGDYRNHRFEYGGYSFGFVDPWPSNWLYTQNVYVIEIDGVYYLCNPMYPGVNLALTFAL
jgi:outer membrane biosynthesis protein TonB